MNKRSRSPFIYCIHRVKLITKESLSYYGFYCGFIGTVINLDLVLEFSDILLLAMSLPNLLGCFMLSGIIARDLDDYMTRLKSGGMLAEATQLRQPVLK